jgi:SAM-dependent methyltransferase
MPRLISARTTWRLLRAGDLRARLRANRDGAAAIRLHLVAAAFDTGLLDALTDEEGTTAELARRLDVADESLVGSFLRAAAAGGLVMGGGVRPWHLSDRGRAVVEDDLVRATYEAFAGFHTALYREMKEQLRGGPARRDVVEQGGLIARISAAFEPFLLDVLSEAVAECRPRRVLDVGCGAGLQLAAMLEAAPEATGVGVDTDPDAAVLAEQTLVRRGVADRAEVLHADIRRPAEAGAILAGPFDFALLSNVVYYVPVGERVALLREVASLLRPGGVLLVVTTVATPQFVSRHFDLLLRAQEGRMELPEADALARQMTAAGLRPGPPRRVAPGAPLIALAATLPG